MPVKIFFCWYLINPNFLWCSLLIHTSSNNTIFRETSLSQHHVHLSMHVASGWFYPRKEENEFTSCKKRSWRKKIREKISFSLAAEEAPDWKFVSQSSPSRKQAMISIQSPKKWRSFFLVLCMISCLCGGGSNVHKANRINSII